MEARGSGRHCGAPCHWVEGPGWSRRLPPPTPLPRPALRPGALKPDGRGLGGPGGVGARVGSSGPLPLPSPHTPPSPLRGCPSRCLLQPVWSCSVPPRGWAFPGQGPAPTAQLPSGSGRVPAPLWVIEACGCSELLPSSSLGGATASLHTAQSPSQPWSHFPIRHSVLPGSGPRACPEFAQGGLCTPMSPDAAPDFLGLPRPAMGERGAGPAPPAFLLLLL